MNVKPKHSANWWVTLVCVLFGGLLVLGVAYDAPIYQRPIAKITNVRNERPVKQQDEFENQDATVHQRINAVLINTIHKGQKITLSNTYSRSGAMDQPYRAGNQVFISKLTRGQQSNIKGPKRDTVVALLTWIVISLLFVFMRSAGFMALLSVGLNAVLFFLAINIDLSLKNGNVFVIFSLISVVFAALTLWLVLGWSRQTVITLTATLSGTALAIIISLIVFALTHERGMHYEGLQYVTTLPRPLFLAETLIGSLGAVMDESTDIVATLFELQAERPDVSRNQLFLSGRNVGRSIMGPLINVLFLIFVADTFPLTLLYLKNGNNWGYTYMMNMSMGVIQSLISGLGIVLAIPVASFVASRLMKKRVMTDDNL
ncbi:YibE/F family protein [Furfurilactobacillus milii]|uniref:YibE/F family protein n=1 Tax=Furfurilactobacillus milii TaxID=2888272 RepID=A0A6N9I4D7_9LACO|nr:YibE/F family protein [Furfurilactobacillus milii]MYV17830.1 YibE/F family protein [Furfurilactobacillus milii]